MQNRLLSFVKSVHYCLSFGWDGRNCRKINELSQEFVCSDVHSGIHFKSRFILFFWNSFKKCVFHIFNTIFLICYYSLNNIRNNHNVGRETTKGQQGYIVRFQNAKSCLTNVISKTADSEEINYM